ncbi:GerMN domain-containing protein [Paenibacillus hexagrammi]|uniref:GerMN domain-containing protein n=1 Tax=Paenibacillus hexagrammi TaxID=2908839 RepID=A0ABY3SDY0_9BACL|nr:GerMN domain-containing protein [Paenibacillus sp. YPD9-1]UJF32042.1 GerMN domain-containing protein [Paenibacillus sp. YPD9-1]
MKQQHWIRSAAMAGVIALLTTGCSIMGSGEKKDIDAPPQAGTEADAQTTSGAVTIDMAADNSSQMTVYVKDAKGFVAPVSLGLPKSPSVARTTLEYMVNGGPVSSLLPAGFQALLPQDTKILGVNVQAEKKQAVVDFSKEFLNYDQQDERKILEAITWALTSFPTVEKVQLRVEGKELKEMPKGKTPLEEPMSRMMGINIEKADDAEFGQSTPVTLYFLNQNDQNYKYYVPVTRLVKRTDDVAKAVVDQLIKGPDQKKGLTAVMNATTEVKSVTKANDLITVDFSDKLLGADQKASADALQSVILSLTENTGINKVQIKVDGAVKITSSDDQSYSKPVSRPAHVNPVKL